jgi:hypothetical protein
MMWIPGGALVAGTAPDHLPRIADEEMPGEQVILKPFYIDVFPYPNEEGAIALTNVTQAEAEGLCLDQGKRLCSELEWERACKGPQNSIYEYGDVYRPDRCGTGTAPAMRPTGIRVGCRSDFGVHDMHGGVWEWTSSPWGRGNSAALATLRGGNSPAGELVGRCSNAMGRPPETKSDTVGFRCCGGPRNEAEVSLTIVRGKRLEHEEPVDKALTRAVIPLLPEQARQDLKDTADLKLERMWFWRPIGNEELIVLGGCTGIARDPRCGAVVVRVLLDRPNVVAWVPSGYFFPAVQTDADARDIWVYGGDDLGRFRRLVAYVWGRVSVGQPERKLPKPPKRGKAKPKGK